jgi:DtxR family Mn-dependent transcriptional regulator
MPKIDLNPTIEDYLRSMYRIVTRAGRVSNAALARDLNISSAAVTEMLRRLADQGLLEYRRYEEPRLTKRGMDVAVSVTRRHRLWEVFLIQHLAFEWDEVHALADQLEHIGSDVLIDRLDRFLGFPTHDPHGDPIPTKEGRIPERTLVPICDLAPGDEAVVESVSDELPELLRYAASLRLALKTPIRVVERIAFDGSVRLIAGEHESVISEKLASSVFVSRTSGTATASRSRKRAKPR